MKRIILTTGLLLFLAAALIMTACSSDGEKQTQVSEEGGAAMQSQKIEPTTLTRWRLLGTGSVSLADEDAVLLTEQTTESKGITLMSPETYGEHITLSFKAKPLSYESVNVVIISASEGGTGNDVTIPGGYNGNFDFWTSGPVQNYLFAFHNGAHDRNPFLWKNPGQNQFAEASSNIMGEDWHSIEIKRDGGKLSLTIDGELIIEGMDEDPLPGGRICFRMRGTPDAPASCLFKDVMITEMQ